MNWFGHNKEKSSESKFLYHNPEAPDSATEFWSSLNVDKIREWATQMHKHSETESIQEVVSDRLLLALEVISELLKDNESFCSEITELRSKVNELDESAMEEHHKGVSAMKDWEWDVDTWRARGRNWKMAARRFWLSRNEHMETSTIESKNSKIFRDALLQISTSPCQKSRMFVKACKIEYKEAIQAWCPSCRAEYALKAV